MTAANCMEFNNSCHADKNHNPTTLYWHAHQRNQSILQSQVIATTLTQG